MDNIQVIIKEGENKHSTSFDTKQLLKIIVNGETVYERKEPFYKIIAIVGPSGCGKTTIMDEIIGPSGIKDTVFHPLVFSTSRPRRKNESKKAYYFYTKEDFEDMIEHNDMIQYSIFNDWYYGLETAELSQSKINIGIFSPEAIINLKNTLGEKAEIEIFYIEASEKTRLMRCLQREDAPDVKEIIRRYCADREDFNNYFDKNKIFFTSLTNETKKDIEKCSQIIDKAGWRMKWGD